MILDQLRYPVSEPTTRRMKTKMATTKTSAIVLVITKLSLTDRIAFTCYYLKTSGMELEDMIVHDLVFLFLSSLFDLFNVWLLYLN